MDTLFLCALHRGARVPVRTCNMACHRVGCYEPVSMCCPFEVSVMSGVFWKMLAIYRVLFSWYHRFLTAISLEVLCSYKWWPLAHVVEHAENTMLIEKMWFQYEQVFWASQPIAILSYYMHWQFLNVCSRPSRTNCFRVFGIGQN